MDVIVPEIEKWTGIEFIKVCELFEEKKEKEQK